MGVKTRASRAMQSIACAMCQPALMCVRAYVCARACVRVRTGACVRVRTGACAGVRVSCVCARPGAHGLREATSC